MPEEPVSLDRLARRAERLARIRADTEHRLDGVLGDQLDGRPESPGPGPSPEGSVLIPVGLVVVGMAAALGLLVAGAPPPSALAPIGLSLLAALLARRRLTTDPTAAPRPAGSRATMAARAAAAAHERALRDWRAAWIRSGSGPQSKRQEKL